MIIHNINDLIKYGIHVHGGSSIPGIGTIKISRTPASYSIDRKKLSAPSSTLSYYDHESEELSIYHYGEACGIAAGQIKLWCEDMYRLLADNNTTIFIPEVGALSKNESGVVFISDTSTNWNTYSIWPDLEIQPISNPKKTYEFAVSQPKELTYTWKKNQNDTSSWLFPGIVILLILLFFAIKTCIPDQSKSENSENNQKSFVNQKEFVKNNTLDSGVQDIENQLNKNTSLNDSVSLHKEKNKHTILNDSSEVPTWKKSQAFPECTYIVGAFLKLKNAENLHNSLRNEGYETIMLKHDSFTRVGIIIPCDKDQRVPEKILNTFPDIWLLEE